MMTPARRTAEMQAEHHDWTCPVDHVAQRRHGIMESEWTEGRWMLAFCLAAHRPLTIQTARLALSAAPKGMDISTAQAWASHLVEPDRDSLGVTHGH